MEMNKKDRNKDMTKVYDQVKKDFITPRMVDMHYAATYDKSDDESDDEIGDEQSDSSDISDLELKYLLNIKDKD